MLTIPGLLGLKKILWKDIEPGMIVISGLRVNNTIPHELANFPALTVGQIFEMNQRYHFKKDKEIVVAVCKKGESSQKMSLGFQGIQKRIQVFNSLRKKILTKNGRKEVSELMRERNIPIPVREYIPILELKGEIHRILFPLWDAELKEVQRWEP